jgi:hypothetical protein
MAPGKSDTPAYVPANEFGVGVFPFRVEHPNNIFAFERCEILPGVTVRAVPDGDLQEYQFIWDRWVQQRGLGLAERWVRPNMMIVVEGEKYVPEILERTKEWFPQKDLDKMAAENPRMFQNDFIVSRYAAHRHVFCSMLLLKPCPLSFLESGFVWNRDARGNWRSGSYGASLPVKNFSREAVAALHGDHPHAIAAIELREMAQRMEIYFAPIFWNHDRIATALGSYWNFLISGSYETAFLSLITVIEALVGARFEVTHQICERVAVSLGDDLQTRKDLYNQLKRIYDLRSRFVHGHITPKKGPVGRTQAYLDAKISSIDIHKFRAALTISSRLLARMVQNDDYISVLQREDSDLDDYFINMILS